MAIPMAQSAAPALTMAASVYSANRSTALPPTCMPTASATAVSTVAVTSQRQSAATA
jgi:hypothetical protein